ncbi:uncharacterized protein LOC5498446 isoform X2 [Nematostella vectensis]|uniref:uncharacterized protein LOC5498446 isoform X2 n=1 Tax=Nematostella vectensis TaxID=45351 RepID=UPI002077369E|nr:uncharacterized protein LOC5498446 isoform X2 [Nematostella vectensis]
MHDVLEGVLQYVVKEVLKVLINEKRLFTLDELNTRIRTFDFGYHSDTNRPAPIQPTRLVSNDHTLKQHANQMWCLGMFLPLLVGDLVPEDDEHWELFCILLQIMRIVFSPVIDKEQLPYLQVLIQHHHQMFQQLFPGCSITPKMHYMVHMPTTILKLGPLVHSWCMRYEAKHHYFKRTAILLGNWINLPFSLAKRHQEGLCYRLQTAGGGLSTFIEKGKESLAGDVSYWNLVKAEFPNVDVGSSLYDYDDVINDAVSRVHFVGCPLTSRQLGLSLVVSQLSEQAARTDLYKPTEARGSENLSRIRLYRKIIGSFLRGTAATRDDGDGGGCNQQHDVEWASEMPCQEQEGIRSLPRGLRSSKQTFEVGRGQRFR